jgi:hypothetical protein
MWTKEKMRRRRRRRRRRSADEIVRSHDKRMSKTLSDEPKNSRRSLPASFPHPIHGRHHHHHCYITAYTTLLTLLSSSQATGLSALS